MGIEWSSAQVLPSGVRQRIWTNDGGLYGARKSMPMSEALVMCDDGDLLLSRANVTVTTSRQVSMPPEIVKNIVDMVHGDFSSVHAADLPIWNRCGILLRKDGELHILHADKDGLSLGRLEDVLEAGSKRNDKFAVRRFRCPEAFESIISLKSEIETTNCPRWTKLIEVLSKKDTSQANAVELPPSLRKVLTRTLQLYLCQTATPSTTVVPVHQDPIATLNAALIVAFYEHLAVVSPSQANSTSYDALHPSSLASYPCQNFNHVRFISDTLLATEAALINRSCQ